MSSHVVHRNVIFSKWSLDFIAKYVTNRSKKNETFPLDIEAFGTVACENITIIVD